ncbi:MAG: hypothetical protein PHE83_13360 [Opitutaceae bacterium]|nr:hypothetical protein [Opitutaceae bacterium]
MKDQHPALAKILLLVPRNGKPQPLMNMNRRIMNQLVCSGALLLGVAQQVLAADPAAVFRLEADPAHARIPVLSWDTEGGDRAKMNLLRTDTAVGLRIKMNGQWRGGETFATRVEKVGGAETRYRLALAPDAELTWRLQPGAGRLTMRFDGQGAGLSRVEGLELEFPFDPRVAATTLIPQVWDDEGNLHLPAIISAPDFGQMLLRAAPEADLKGRLTGGRANHTVDFTLELPVPQSGTAITLSLEPVRLPAPAGLQDQSLWRAARRGWFNAIEPSAQWNDWGYGDNRSGAPAGILANNVISDPVSCMIHMWADQALLTPSLPAGISVSNLVRRTVDWWLDHRTKPTGEVIAYWDYADMLDTNASPLISAWDYVEATGDRAWLARRIERLEFIAQYLVKRDVDNDGLVESTHSGNYGTLIEPLRGGSAYDTINAGFKDAYCNAQIYRAFRCLADLERQLQRPERQQQYTERADRLKAAYVKTFFNPATGWLAWWKSEDGEVHDLSSPMISSLAICYGLVEPSQGRQMLDRLWNKIEAVGFKRFDLGVPLTLVPVRRGDYLIGLEGPGSNCPKKEDGSDTFGQYLNGGCCVSDAVYFITALHIAGEHARGDRILRAMVERQERGVFPNGGGFQNGVVNEGPRGAEFYDWNGETTGYEGHLTYSFSFLQAILLREPALRARLFRPLQ